MNFVEDWVSVRYSNCFQPTATFGAPQLPFEDRGPLCVVHLHLASLERVVDIYVSSGLLPNVLCFGPNVKPKTVCPGLGRTTHVYLFLV